MIKKTLKALLFFIAPIFLLVLVLSLYVVKNGAYPQNFEGVVVKGIVVDEASGEPISGAKVLVSCCHERGLDKSDCVSKEKRTDSAGHFRSEFEKGHDVRVAAKGPKFYPGRVQKELGSDSIAVELELHRIDSAKVRGGVRINASFGSGVECERLNEGIPGKHSFVPFLRQRVYSEKKGAESEDEGSKVELYGYDFSEGTNTKDLTKADVWIKAASDEEYPTTIVAGKGGGITPIRHEEVTSDLFFEKFEAPSSGYKNEYEMKGNEAGFFVMTRDGNFSKFINRGELERTGPQYSEKGYTFSSVYQPDGSGSFHHKCDVDLEAFIY